MLVKKIPDRVRAWGSLFLIFLFPAVAITTPRGMGLVEAILLVLGLWSLADTGLRREFCEAKWVVLAISADLMIAIGSTLYFSLGWNALDYPIRIMIALLFLPLLARARFSSDWLWYGVFAGAIGAAALSLFQHFALDLQRARGFTLEILFGDIGLALGLMALASRGEFVRRRSFWLPYFAFFCGVLTSILSGSRGGWIAMILSAIPLYVYDKKKSRGKSMLVAASGLILLIAAFFIPATQVALRSEKVFVEARNYFEANVANTPTGARLEMWKAAALAFREHPVFGVGKYNFSVSIKELENRGQVSASIAGFNHAHNEILEVMATQGVFGLAGLLMFYLLPLRFFIRNLDPGERHNPFALAGIMLVLCYIDFGLSQVMFAHHLGIAFYAFMVCLLAGLCLKTQRESRGVPSLTPKSEAESCASVQS
jgi:O-antigen ligase